MLVVFLFNFKHNTKSKTISLDVALLRSLGFRPESYLKADQSGRIWKLKNTLYGLRFRDTLTEKFYEEEEKLQTCNIEGNWDFLQVSLLSATDQIRGLYKIPTWTRVTLWKNDATDNVTGAK